MTKAFCETRSEKRGMGKGHRSQSTITRTLIIFSRLLSVWLCYPRDNSDFGCAGSRHACLSSERLPQEQPKASKKNDGARNHSSDSKGFPPDHRSCNTLWQSRVLRLVSTLGTTFSSLGFHAVPSPAHILLKSSLVIRNHTDNLGPRLHAALRDR